MFYATGGVAWEKVEYAGQEANEPPNFATDFRSVTSFNQTKSGWVVGGGAEWMATTNILPPSGVSVLRFQFRCQRIGALVPESRRLPGGLQLQLVQLQRSGLPGGSELRVLRPSRTLTPVSVSDSKEAMGHAARRGPFGDLGAVTQNLSDLSC